MLAGIDAAARAKGPVVLINGHHYPNDVVRRIVEQQDGPVIVIGASGTASVIRVMRGNLLDVLGHQHIQTGRAKGLAERVVIFKYGVRIAINPLVSRLGLELPNLLSGAVVTGIVSITIATAVITVLCSVLGL